MAAPATSKARSNLWLAEYGSRLRYRMNSTLATLLSSTIDSDEALGDQILDILMTICRGDNPQITISHAHIQALLSANREAGWEFVERLLLAAQRQEGLRQVILESVDRAHVAAFRRILALINRENLVRFNSVVRAVDVWFKLGFDVTQTKYVANTLLTFERFLSDLEMRERGIGDENPHTGYLALIAQGFEDVEPAIAAASDLLQSGTPDQRLMAAQFLKIVYLPPANQLLVELIGDEDEHISILAHNHLRYYQAGVPADFFEIVESRLSTLPKKEKVLPPRVWPWLTLKYEPEATGYLLERARGERSLARLFPHLHYFNGYSKGRTIRLWYKQNPAESWSPEMRAKTFEWLGDRSSDVRHEAGRALIGKVSLTVEEALLCEGYLTRKASDLRKSTLGLLLTQDGESVFASAERLLASGKAPQRQAGLQLLVKLHETEQWVERCRERATAFKDGRKKLSATEETLLNQISSSDGEQIDQIDLEDGLGLINHTNRTRPHVPQDLSFVSTTKEAVELIVSLWQCIEANKALEFQFPQHDGGTGTALLDNVRRHGHNIGLVTPEKTRAENLERLVLKEIWFSWWEAQAETLAKGDGYDLLRAYAIAKSAPRNVVWLQREKKKIYNLGGMLPQAFIDKQLNSAGLITLIFEWLLYLFPLPEEKDAFTFLLDGVEQTYWHLLHSEDDSLYWIDTRGHNMSPASTM
ncbi:MAG: hypothetical protein AAF633_27700, partial [Chloroflexota bacterium]